MKYQTLNGWTKEKMVEQIKKYNNGTKAWSDSISACMYLTSDNNRCAAGCFIPDAHPGLRFQGSVDRLVTGHPGLEKLLPLNISGMMMMQNEHDRVSTSENVSMHDILTRWIESNVEDAS